MNDEGVGIAGWLLADLVLVLAIVFLALTPAALSGDSDIVEATPTPEPTVAPPVILDIGCAKEGALGARSIAVHCTPELGGGGVDTHSWEAERGQAFAAPADFSANFEDEGAVHLTVTNAGGKHSASFPVLLPQVSPGGLLVKDFRFDQIVIKEVRLAFKEQETIDAITKGSVREELNKSEEDEELGELSESVVADFLTEKLNEGLRIALVETFSNEPRGSHRILSERVNKALYEWLLGWREGVTASFFDCKPLEKWFASYQDEGFPEGQVRINLYFVHPQSDADCP